MKQLDWVAKNELRLSPEYQVLSINERKRVMPLLDSLIQLLERRFDIQAGEIRKFIIEDIWPHGAI